MKDIKTGMKITKGNEET